MTFMLVLDYFALFLIFFVILTLVYGIIAIHDIPYLMAVKRHHPHQDAIHVTGWISLFFMHVLWPLFGYGLHYIVLIVAGVLLMGVIAKSILKH